MRRSFKGNPLYTSVFNEYLHNLFTRGFPSSTSWKAGVRVPAACCNPRPACWR